MRLSEMPCTNYLIDLRIPTSSLALNSSFSSVIGLNEATKLMKKLDSNLAS